jgi:hypothetical protein
VKYEIQECITKYHFEPLNSFPFKETVYIRSGKTDGLLKKLHAKGAIGEELKY